MKKVRIYSLKKELGLNNCTPILDACKQVGINVKSASNTITKSQARQVAALVMGGHSVPSLRSPKSTRTPKRKSQLPASQATPNSIPAIALDSSKAKSCKQRSKRSARTTATPQGPSAKSAASNHSPQVVLNKQGAADREIAGVRRSAPQYLNGNRMFSLKLAGGKSARMRHAITTYTVPFDRLCHEIQRINRSDARILEIDVLH